MDSGFPKPCPMCGGLLSHWKAKCPFCGESRLVHLGPPGRLSRALETRRRVARFMVIVSVIVLLVGWLPLVAIVGVARHLTPLPYTVLDYLPDVALIASAVLGIGGGIVWVMVDRRRVNPPGPNPGLPNERD